VGAKRVRRLMKAAGIAGIRPALPAVARTAATRPRRRAVTPTNHVRTRARVPRRGARDRRHLRRHAGLRSRSSWRSMSSPHSRRSSPCGLSPASPCRPYAAASSTVTPSRSGDTRRRDVRPWRRTDHGARLSALAWARNPRRSRHCGRTSLSTAGACARRQAAPDVAATQRGRRNTARRPGPQRAGGFKALDW